MTDKRRIRVLVWSEGREQIPGSPYGRPLQAVLAEALGEDDDASGVVLETQNACLDDPGQGVPDEVLAETDVLVWWSHKRHGDIAEDTIARIDRHVQAGLGFFALHSTQGSLVMQRLLGRSCSVRWREDDGTEFLWPFEPAHPLVQGIAFPIRLEEEEMYGEPFDIPPPDTLVLGSWFEGGEIFRSGCVWHRGHGHIYFLRPGHETVATYDAPAIRRLLRNGCRWLAHPAGRAEILDNENVPQPPFP